MDEHMKTFIRLKLLFIYPFTIYTFFDVFISILKTTHDICNVLSLL